MCTPPTGGTIIFCTPFDFHFRINVDSSVEPEIDCVIVVIEGKN